MKDAKIIRYTNLKSKYFDERPFALDDTGVSHREITYWDSKELLPFKAEHNRWRRFNLIELTWIRFIAKLRKLNVGLNTINRIKQEMFKDISSIIPLQSIKDEAAKNLEELDPDFDTAFLNRSEVEDGIKGIRLTYIEFLIYGIVGENMHASVAISIKTDSSSSSKEVELVSDELFMEIILWDELFKRGVTPESIDTLLTTCICISMNEVLGDMFSLVSEIKLARLFSLTEKELKILEVLRKGKYKQITVRFDKVGQPNLILMSEELKINPTARLIDIMNQKAYEDFEIKTEDGKVVAFKRETKIKI